jgi:DNA transformation protein and related proteins
MSKSLRSSEGFRQFVLDQLQTLNVTPQPMFGATGLYSNGCFFGIIARDVLYLKVDESNRKMFEREGMKPFKPYSRRSVSMKYFQVPLAVLESALELEHWARLSIAVAAKAEAAEPVEAIPKPAVRSASRGRQSTSTAQSARGRRRR